MHAYERSYWNLETIPQRVELMRKILYIIAVLWIALFVWQTIAHATDLFFSLEHKWCNVKGGNTIIIHPDNHGTYSLYEDKSECTADYRSISSNPGSIRWQCGNKKIVLNFEVLDDHLIIRGPAGTHLYKTCDEKE